MKMRENMNNITNLQRYEVSRLKYDTAEMMKRQIEKLLDQQNELVEQLDYETSNLKESLTDDELLSLESF